MGNIIKQVEKISDENFALYAENFSLKAELVRESETLNAEIDRLQAENAELRKSKWISVEDRLPEFDTDVLAAYFEHHIKEYWIDKRIDFLDDETFELVDSMWTEGAPTHWQPLPPPPDQTDE